MAASIGEISGGRFVLGLGAGWAEGEFQAFGIPDDHRVSRFEEAFTIIQGLLAGRRVTLDGRFHHADDLVLLPRPEARVPLLLGSNGKRMLSIGLPHVDAWNTWFADYGNTPEGFASLNARISSAAEAAGRRAADIERSACVFVLLDRSAGGRPITAEAPPVEGDARHIATHLRELHAAGADEAILVVSPIDERSIRALAPVLQALDA